MCGHGSLASELAYERENSRHRLENIIISETFLTVGELREIIAVLEGFTF